jgi:mRNA interferase RelE/StbE
VAYRVELTSGAQRDLSPLPADLLDRVRHRFKDLSENPRLPGARKLKGGSGYLRLRVGDYRILYEVDDATRLLTVARVLHRRDAYRRL